MVAYSIYSQTYVKQGIRIIGNICNDCSAVVERVPCKLNNERNEKHQTGAGKIVKAVWNATEACLERVKSITARGKDKKFLKL